MKRTKVAGFPVRFNRQWWIRIETDGDDPYLGDFGPYPTKDAAFLDVNPLLRGRRIEVSEDPDRMLEVVVAL